MAEHCRPSALFSWFHMWQKLEKIKTIQQTKGTGTLCNTLTRTVRLPLATDADNRQCIYIYVYNIPILYMHASVFQT